MAAKKRIEFVEVKKGPSSSARFSRKAAGKKAAAKKAVVRKAAKERKK